MSPNITSTNSSWNWTKLSSSTIPAKPIYPGGSIKLSPKKTPMRFTENNEYLGPERPIVIAPFWLRVIASIYYIIVISMLTLILNVSLSLNHCLAWIIARIRNGHDDDLFRWQMKMDYVCGMFHEGAACFMSWAMHPCLKFKYQPNCPYLHQMQWTRGDKITENDQLDIEAEMSIMRKESEANWWNRVRALFGLKKYFVISRAVAMSNHLSNADGVIGRGLSFPSGSKILYKGSLASVPFFGWTFQLAGDIKVPFKSNSWKTETGFREELHAQLDRLSKHRLPVMVFPEGTRSRYRRLAPFRKGMFEYAFDNSMPIWPMAIYGTQYAMPCGEILLNPTEIQVMYSNTLIFPHGHTLASFTKAVRDQILNLLKTNVPEYDDEADVPIDCLDEFKLFEQKIRNKNVAPIVEPE